MNLLILTLHSLLPLFALIGLGFALRRWSLLHHEHVPVLNGLVVNVLLPAAILLAMLRAPALSPRMMLLPLLMLIVELLVLALWFGLSRGWNLPGATLGALMLTSTFGNTAFLGYPIAQALLPRQFPTAVMIDEFGMMIFLYPAAALLGGWFAAEEEGRGKTAAALKGFLRSPLLLALLTGLALRLIPVPSFLMKQPAFQSATAMIYQCLTYLAQATTAVVLLALGVALNPRSSGGSALALWSACGIKLLLAPVLMWALCRLAGVGGEARLAGILQAAMPSGVLTAVLARQHALDHRLAVRIVCVTTALSAVTISVMMTLLR